LHHKVRKFTILGGNEVKKWNVRILDELYKNMFGIQTKSYNTQKIIDLL